MKVLKSPYINSAIVSIISFVYASIFILTNNHLEFQRILNHGLTLKSSVWNGWSEFLRQGNLKYIGYIYIAAVICIIILSIVRKGNYDEYQVSILTTSFAITGFALLLLFPVALVLVLSDANYAIETITFLIVAHWSIFLIADLTCTVRWFRQ